MITIYHKTVKDAQIRKIKNRKPGSWFRVVTPTEEEIQWLVSELGLEDGLIRDALDTYEVPRLEKKDAIIYVFNRTPVIRNDEVITIPILIAIGDNFVVTISNEVLEIFEQLTKRKQFNSQLTFSTTQKGRLVATLIYEITNDFNKQLINIRKQVRSRQVKLEHITNKDIMQMVAFESTLNDFLSALMPMRRSMEILTSGKILKLYEDDHDYIEDLFLSNGQLIEACKNKLKTIINIREAYSTIMTNNLNRVLRFFAALTIILTIPTIVGSMLGMNVPVPLASSSTAFYTILGSTILATIIVFIIFVKNKWI